MVKLPKINERRHPNKCVDHLWKIDLRLIIVALRVCIQHNRVVQVTLVNLLNENDFYLT